MIKQLEKDKKSKEAVLKKLETYFEIERVAGELEVCEGHTLKSVLMISFVEVQQGSWPVLLTRSCQSDVT